MKKYLLLPLGAICLNWSAAALSADFVAVRVEAEDFTSKSDRWALTSETETPDFQPDPDPPHNSTASGKANLELLPDSRVTHDDEVHNGGLDGNFWGGPGGGPRIDYDVFVPEAGRYLVWVKTFSTGTEDNGIHVGINGTLPESGKRIQICSKHNWFWTSGQRTDENHCGVSKTIWLDVPEAGVNTVTFFAREDGFEIDQFMLIKETHDGSMDCFPNIVDNIRCRDINTGATLSDTTVAFSRTVTDNTVLPEITQQPDPVAVTPEEEVDLDIDINVIGNTHFIEDSIEYRVVVTNEDDDHTATDTVAKIDLPSGLTFDASADCTHSGSQVTCNFGDLSAGEDQTRSFTARVTTEGNHRVDGQVTADQDDTRSQNDTDSATITASNSIPDFEAGITMQQAQNAVATGGANSYTIEVTNNGLQTISNAIVNVSAADGITLSGCAPVCSVPTIAPGGIATLSFTTVATQSGAITAQLQLTDDADTSNNTASSVENVIASVIAAPFNGQVVIEAEAFSSNTAAATDNAPKWLLINEQFTPLDRSLDPDLASPADVSGTAYMELLPDFRLDGNAPVIDGVSNFSTGGTGATLTYDVFFSEPGDYTVFARVRPNNTQDASLHVGIDNNWSNTPLAACNPDGSWQWTSSVASDTGCQTGVQTLITVTTPGMHVVMVSQEADGLELDKLILSQNAASAPSGNGPAPTTFNTASDADISVNGSFTVASVARDETAEFEVSVINNSSEDSFGIVVNIDGLQPVNIPSGTFDSCVSTGSGVVCSLTTLTAGTVVSETFTVTATAPIDVNTSVSAAVADFNTANNTASTRLQLVDTATPETSSGGGSSGGGSITLWLLTLLLLSATALKAPLTRQIVLQKNSANNVKKSSQV